MVIISSSILVRGSGSVLLSRQYLPLTSSRVEGLYLSFGRYLSMSMTAIGAEFSSSSSSSTLENTLYRVPGDAGLRFLYTNLSPGLILSLLFTIESNVLSVVELLHSMNNYLLDLIPTRPLDENVVREWTFEVLNMMDEYLAPDLALPFGVSRETVRTALAMDSQTEKMEEMISKDKEKEAKAKAKEKLKQMEAQRREAAKKGTSMSGMGSFPSSSASPTPMALLPAESVPLLSSRDSNAIGTGSGVGMVLSKKKKPSAFDLTHLDHALPLSASSIASPAPALPSSSQGSTAPASPRSSFEGVLLSCDEKLTIRSHRDGGLEVFELKGELNIFVSSPQFALPCLSLSLDASLGPSIQYKTHPNMDKKSFSDSAILVSKDREKSLPVGQSLSILKWRFTTTDESAVPLSVNCWPTRNDARSCYDLIIEYNLESKLPSIQDLVISVPCPNRPHFPSSTLTLGTDWHNGLLEWRIPSVHLSDSPNGVLEFSVPLSSGAQLSESDFFPVSSSWCSTTHTFCAIQIVSVQDVQQTGQSLPFQFQSRLATEEYSLV